MATGNTYAIPTWGELEHKIPNMCQEYTKINLPEDDVNSFNTYYALTIILFNGLLFVKFDVEPTSAEELNKNLNNRELYINLNDVFHGELTDSNIPLISSYVHYNNSWAEAVHKTYYGDTSKNLQIRLCPGFQIDETLGTDMYLRINVYKENKDEEWGVVSFHEFVVF